MLIKTQVRIGIEMAIQFAKIEFLTRSKGGDSCRKAAYNARTIVKISRQI
ncbi:putative conjugative transfer protein TraA [Orientia tsutsugamushi str. UT76]|nr:putative conjugative transfer protein TraA [Orientia tsutsugamushi str. UT76]